MAIEGDTRQYMVIQCTRLNTLRYMEIDTLGHSRSLQLCIARNDRCPADVLQLKGGFQHTTVTRTAPLCNSVSFTKLPAETRWCSIR